MRGSGVPDKTDGTSVGLFVRRWASTSPSNRSNRQGFWNHAHVSDPRSIVPRLRLDRFGAVERPRLRPATATWRWAYVGPTDPLRAAAGWPPLPLLRGKPGYKKDEISWVLGPIGRALEVRIDVVQSETSPSQ